MNKTLISIEELKQIALREIHTYPGCEDVSAVGIYPVTDEVVESNWSAQVSSRIQSVVKPIMPASSALVLSGRRVRSLLPLPVALKSFSCRASAFAAAASDAATRLR